MARLEDPVNRGAVQLYGRMNGAGQYVSLEELPGDFHPDGEQRDDKLCWGIKDTRKRSTISWMPTHDEWFLMAHRLYDADPKFAEDLREVVESDGARWPATAPISFKQLDTEART